ncbi:FAD-dependent oxidoreductase [Leifsonia sp. A12D58]|uniref:FAD-dependent oxidoreductase n=1 Tax=Leifsonia sp. A12D58 TaxID=3397674 RepID=UPI0039DF949E
MRDVVIVGGGPVGMLLACVLAQRGLDIEVLEQRVEPARLSRAIGIHPPSLVALGHAGVADAVLAGAARIRDGEVWSDGSRLGSLTFDRLRTEHRFVASLPQHVTEELLAARLHSLAPGALRRGVRVTSVRDLPDRVVVGVEQGEGAGEIDARFVLAADGARSTVRAAAGIPWREYGHPETYLMADFPADAALESIAVLYFERSGVVESLPLPGGQRRWVALTAGLQTGASGADLADIIRSRTGVQLPATTDTPSAFTARQRLAGRFVSGRTVLVGDAAHEISPIGGQGMNLGWLDVLELAPALEQAVRGSVAGATAAADTLAGLRRYDQHRRSKARMAMRQAGFNMAMGRPIDGVPLRARNSVVRVLALPPANGVVARAFTMRWL